MIEHSRELISSIVEHLRAADIPLRGGEQADWENEARLLVERSSADDPTRNVEQLLAYRMEGIPLGYLAGAEPFLGETYNVECGIVIPHPATELLALLAVEAVGRHTARSGAVKLMEIGVGVGVVALSVLKRRPAVEAHCSELSGACLRLTRDNARRILGSADNLFLYQAYAAGDLFSPFRPRGLKDVAVLVSNPPYLVEGDEVSEATKKSGVAHFSYAPEDDPSWFLQCVLDAPEGLLSQDCSVLMECAEWYLPEHEEVMRDGGWQTESFDRESYVARFGAPPEMREMTPTAHRVLHAWRGAGGPLGG